MFNKDTKSSKYTSIDVMLTKETTTPTVNKKTNNFSTCDNGMNINVQHELTIKQNPVDTTIQIFGTENVPCFINLSGLQ